VLLLITIRLNDYEFAPGVPIVGLAIEPRPQGGTCAILGVKGALMFILFHKLVCGPLANSLFHHPPDEALKPASNVKTAYHKADHAVQYVLDLLAA
jgi:hypothetical protein